jgi:hypothetical protein
MRKILEWIVQPIPGALPLLGFLVLCLFYAAHQFDEARDAAFYWQEQWLAANHFDW